MIFLDLSIMIMNSSLTCSTTVIATVQERTLTTEVRSLIEELCVATDKRRRELLELRLKDRDKLADGEIQFLEETTNIRKGKWNVDALPEQLLERRVELMGGATRSELIVGLNSGAKTYIADLWNFTPTDTWNILRAHRSLARAATLDMAYLAPDGDRIRVNPRSVTRLMVVPRPIGTLEPAVLFNGNAVAATYFDLALLVLNCGHELVERHGGIFLVLRDVRTHLEARLWVQLFDILEEQMGFERGTIRATIMIDSISAAIEAEEILFEMMHHAAGLSFDPQGYAADHIDLFAGKERPVLPDRELIGLNSPFLRSLSLDLVGLCHRRGCHALGAPSFVLPPLDPERVKADYLEMLADKEREAVDGFDGTIVVHADTVNAAMVEFNKSMPRANQLYYQRNDKILPSDLIRRPEGRITVESLVGMIRTILRSMVRAGEGKAWVVQGGRMHDRSSLRLAVRLLWQWNTSRQGVITASGLDIHDDLIKYLVKKESEKMFGASNEAIRKMATAAEKRLLEIVLADTLPQELAA